MKLFPDLFDRFAEKAGRLRTPASRSSFRYVIAGLQADHPGKEVGRFTPADLTEFCLKGTPAPKTISHRRSVLRAVFEWAHWSGLCATNPSSGLKFSVVPGKHKVRHGNWLSEREVAKVIGSCPPDFMGRRDKIVLMFGFMMGIRRAALADLRWDQFSSDLSVLEISVKGQKRTRKGVPAQLHAELVLWRQGAPDGAVAVIPGLHEQGMVTRETEPHWERPLDRSGITSVVSRAGQRCGVKITPHDMRRSLAGILETKGVPVTDIQRVLDHSNVGTTSIYLDQNPHRTQEATGGITLEL